MICTSFFLTCRRVHLQSLNKHVALQIFPIYYKWKNITQQCKNNKLKIKIIAPTQNDEFELPDSSYSRVYRIYHKKHETLSINPPIHIYINRINDRLAFKIKG